MPDLRYPARIGIMLQMIWRNPLKSRYRPAPRLPARTSRHRDRLAHNSRVSGGFASHMDAGFADHPDFRTKPAYISYKTYEMDTGFVRNSGGFTDHACAMDTTAPNARNRTEDGAAALTYLTKAKDGQDG